MDNYKLNHLIFGFGQASGAHFPFFVCEIAKLVNTHLPGDFTFLELFIVLLNLDQIPFENGPPLFILFRIRIGLVVFGL